MAKKSFYIIDGHAQIYRAYFAPFRDLTSPTGEPTKATFVFTQMLLNLVETRKPDYLAMVIDDSSEVAVFRKEILPEYKANRQKRPEDFGPQEARILQIVRDAGVPIFVKPGFEADDVIATMARQLCGGDFEIFMVTKDKDLRQMLNDCTRMYDVHTNEVMDPAAMEKKLGYTPAQAIEVQTLMGDNIDNIPGIPGVGEKTAAKLVQKYGSADAVMDHLNELTPKLRENFVAFGNKLPVTRKLVTLDQHVEMEFDAETCKFTGLDTEALKTHLSQLGFNALLKRLGGTNPATQPPPRVSAGLLPSFAGGLFGTSSSPSSSASETTAAPAAPECDSAANCTYQSVTTIEQLETLIGNLRKAGRFAFDTETDDLGAMKSQLVGMSFSWEKGTGFYLPVRAPEGTIHLPADVVLPAIKPILEDPTIFKVGHNIKYDLLVMRNVGINVAGVKLDSMIAAFLLDASRMQYGIDRLAMDLLNFRKVATIELLGKGKTQISMDKVDLPKITAYASEDADITYRLASSLDDELGKVQLLRELADDLETPLIDVLAEMEFNGIAVDPAVLKEQSGVLAIRIEELKKKVLEAAGTEFNPDSPKQLAEVLFEKLKLPTGKKTKTGFSTDVQVLERLAEKHAVPKLILDYRSLVKLKNTYLDNLTEFRSEKTGRIHGNFNQTGAGTGRLSMSDPNLQNIPIRTDEGRRIRLAFVPGDAVNNVLLTADYSQIELRLLAHFTQEPGLVKAFADDLDIHTAVASEVFNTPLEKVTRDQRGQAKIINFGIIYGVSAFGLSSRIDGLSVGAAAELIAAYNRRFPGIAEFFKKCVAEAQANGYVETILGRRRPIPDISSGVLQQRNYAERAAINSVVQGSAADLIKVAMVSLHRRMQREKMQSKMLLQVHDELVFETPETAAEAEAAIIREEMSNALKGKLTVPLKVEVGKGKNWQEAK